MNDEEKTASKNAEQLAKIINSRWLHKLIDENLRKKLATLVMTWLNADAMLSGGH